MKFLHSVHSHIAALVVGRRLQVLSLGQVDLGGSLELALRTVSFFALMKGEVESAARVFLVTVLVNEGIHHGGVNIDWKGLVQELVFLRLLSLGARTFFQRLLHFFPISLLRTVRHRLPLFAFLLGTRRLHVNSNLWFHGEEGLILEFGKDFLILLALRLKEVLVGELPLASSSHLLGHQDGLGMPMRTVYHRLGVGGHNIPLRSHEVGFGSLFSEVAFRSKSIVASTGVH